MSLALPIYRMRFACNALNHDPMPCIIQQRAPQTWRGTDWQIEVGLFWGAALVEDVSSIAELHLDIQPDEMRNGGSTIHKVVLAAAIKQNLTLGDWTGGAVANAHAKFTLTRAETQFDMSNATNHRKSFSMVVHAVMTDGGFLTYGRTVNEVEEDGAQNGLAVLSPGAYSFQIQNSDFPTHVHTVRIRGAVDSPMVEIDPGVPL